MQQYVHGILRLMQKIEISHRTVIFIFAFLAGVWFLIQIRDILYLLFIAFLLMTAIRPLVEFLAARRVPRFLAILLIYIFVFGFLGVTFGSTVPSLIAESTKLINSLPTFVSRFLPYVNVDVRSFTQQIAPLGENIFRVTLGIFSNIVSLFTVLVFSFYFLIERRNAEAILTDTMGKEAAKWVLDVLREIEFRLGAWVRGQLLLMTIVGVLVYIGLFILRVEYALPLAIFAGILEILPIIGPNVAAIPAILVALTVSPLLAISVAALYFLVQQVENNIIVPQVMKRSVGFSPLVTIVALMIGGRLAGVAGAALAVPAVLTFQVVLHKWLTTRPTQFRGSSR